MSGRKRIDKSTKLVGQDRAEGPRTALGSALENSELFIDILELVNQRVLGMDVVGKVVELLKESTGFESVGIGLRKGADFPVSAEKRSWDDFVSSENPICSPNNSGDMDRVSHGDPILRFMCGEVARGMADPSLPFFTGGGSFWTNDWSAHLASADRHRIRGFTGDHFSSHGYESVAIVPLRCDREIIGLLQISDTRKSCFSLEMIISLEGIGGILGLVLARIQAKTKLSEGKGQEEGHVATKQLLEEQIDGRTAVEQELRMSRHRLELATQAANLGSWDWNLDTEEVYFDSAWSAMLGYSSSDTRPHISTWQNKIHSEDKLNVLKTLTSHFANPTQYFEAEYRLQAKSGEWRWILDRGKVVERDESGKPLRMAGIYLDITDRKRMEEELHQSAERFRRIFESARDCIFVKDSSLKYTHVNPAFVKMIGLPESDIVGSSDADLYEKDAAEILQEVDRRVLTGQSVEQEHTRLIRRVLRTFLDTKAPMMNSSGETIGVVGISREITDRKRPESILPVAESDCRSPAMRSILNVARLSAQTDTIVLLRGESGAGKGSPCPAYPRSIQTSPWPLLLGQLRRPVPRIGRIGTLRVRVRRLYRIQRSETRIAGTG